MTLTSKKSLSRLVLRAMGLFGGVQSLQIICGIIRMKLVSLWIGPAGVGLFSIYNSAIDLVSSATQLSLRSSAVRDIAGARSRGATIVAAMVLTVRRCGWLFGLLGAVVMLCVAPLLSKVTFGDFGHSFLYALLAINVFLASVTSSEGAILQGLERYKSLALASLWGALCGLIISIPLYYFARIDSIIPSLLVYSIFTAGAMWLYRDRCYRHTEEVTLSTTIATARGFLTLGGYMTAAAFIEQLCNYAFISYLNIEATDMMVGLYQAGNTLINKYVALILVALGMEYYPRLSRVADSTLRSSVYVSHEISLLMVMIVPVATIFISAALLIVKILYSIEFVAILPFIVTAMVGMVLRSFSWCISFLILARSHGKMYIVVETISCIVGLALNIVAFNLYGLDALGWSFTAWYFIYSLMMIIVSRKMGITISSQSYKLLVYALIAVAAQVVLYFTLPMWALISMACATSIFSLILVLRLSGSKI